MFERKILIFMAVVECGSFSAAGKALFMSQSAVSQQINNLEEELGVQLFDRNHYRPKLTDAGQFYYQEVKRLKNDYVRIVTYMQNRTQKHITIGYTTFYTNRLACEFVDKYASQIAHRVEFKYYDLGHEREVLENHDVDMVFGLIEEFKNDDSILYKELYTGQLCLIVSEKHPYASKENIDIHLLKNAPMIIMSPEAVGHYYRYFLKGLKKDGIIPNIIKRVDNLNDLKMSVALNKGVGLLPKEICMANDGIHVIPLKNTKQLVHFGIAYQDLIFEKVANVFADYFKQYKNKL